MKKEERMRRKLGFLLVLIVVAGIAQLAGVHGSSVETDDNDLGVTLHCSLDATSSEIHSELMPSGDYEFFNTPRLSTGTFSHDNTRFDVSNVQVPTANSTAINSYNLTNAMSHTYNNIGRVSEYQVSAPTDTVLDFYINYTGSPHIWNYTGTSYDLTGYVGAPHGGVETQMRYHNGYFYVVKDTNYVYKFDTDWNYVESIDPSHGSGYEYLAIDETTVFLISGSTAWEFDTDWNYVETHTTTEPYIPPLYINNGSLISNDIHRILQWEDDTFNDYQELIEDFGPIPGFTSDYAMSLYFAPAGEIWIISDEPYAYKFDANWNYLGERYALYSGGSSPLGAGYGYLFMSVESNASKAYVLDALSMKVFEHEIWNEQRFSSLTVKNFTYTILGINYTEDISATFDSTDSTVNSTSRALEGNVNYYIDSSMFTQYNNTHDITIPAQNLTVELETPYSNDDVNFSIYCNYSALEFLVPTEAEMQVNAEDVIDETYNAGYVSFDGFPTELAITATEHIYYKLTSETSFTFDLDLTTVSKTYLKKSFKLISNHKIDVDQVELDPDLDVKKVYLNNIELSVSSGSMYDAGQEMAEAAIFTLEIILEDEVYLPLDFVYNNLGSGISTLFLSGETNSLSFSDYTRFDSISLSLPEGYNAKHANLTFSNVKYTPYYTKNDAEDIYGTGFTSPSYGEESVNWGRQYHNTSRDGWKAAESGGSGSGYENIYDQDFSSATGDMAHSYYPDGYNSSYTINNNMSMINRFPQRFYQNNYSRWNLKYNSTFTDSSVMTSGVDLGLSSRLNRDTAEDSLDLNDYSAYRLELGGSYNIAILGGNDDPKGICYHDGSFYVTDSNSDVYQYDNAFSSIETSVDLGYVGPANWAPRGICYYDESFFVNNYIGEKVHEYDSGFNNNEEIYTLVDNPEGLCYHNGSFYVVDYSNEIHQYDSAFSSVEEAHDIAILGGNDDPKGICYHDGSFYVTDSDGNVYQYDERITLESQDWAEQTGHRRKLTIEDGGTERIDNLYIINMSAWSNTPSTSDWTNYTRVFRLESNGTETEINSQPVDQDWGGGDHDSIAILLSNTSKYEEFYVYYGDTDLGAPGYTDSLTVTADSPAADDYSIQQDDYYKCNIDYSSGGSLQTYTRVYSADYQYWDGHPLFSRMQIAYSGTYYNVDDESSPTITQVEAVGGVLTAFKIEGTLKDSGGNSAQDDSGNDINYELIYVFCDCQLVKVYQRITYDDDVSSVTRLDMGWQQFQDVIFDKMSYKYDDTHVVLNNGDLHLDSHIADAKYSCYFDTSNDHGIAIHEYDHSYQNIEDPWWYFREVVGYDNIAFRPDSSNDADTYSAGTDYRTTFLQFDDFTEADGNNDDDGDQPAHRKNTELLTSITETLGAVESFFDYINMTTHFSASILPNQTHDFIRLYCTLNATQHQKINVSVWNNELGHWDVLNGSVLNEPLIDYYTLNNSHINGTGGIKVRIYGENSTSSFNITIAKLSISYNYTQTAGEIHALLNKSTSFGGFLNRYDTYSEYQKLFNLTMSFQFSFSRYTNYTSFAMFNNTYLGDYTFHGQVGRVDDAIDFITGNDGDNTDIQMSVIEQLAGHRYVLDLHDDNGGGYGDYFYSASDPTEGEMSFWIYIGETDKRKSVVLVDDGSEMLELLWGDDGKLYHEATPDVELCSYSLGWQYIALEFSQSQSIYSLWVNGTQVAEGLALKSSTDGVDQINLRTEATAEGYHVYFDAFRFNWTGTYKRFTQTFEIDSSMINESTQLFNVSNGLLEVKGLNYTIYFKCLDLSNRVALGQNFTLNFPLSLDYLQQKRGNYILNYTLIFNPTNDTWHDFYNQINNSYLLVRLLATHEDGSDYIYSYNSNSSISTDFSINVTDCFNALGKNMFKDLTLEILMCGNPFNLTLDNLTLFDFDSDFYRVDHVNISDSLACSDQDLFFGWFASDRYISHVQVRQTDPSSTLILNVSLVNGTHQVSGFFSNHSAGYYAYNLTFYDNYSNWERWQCNLTIVSSISMGLSYENPHFIKTNNSVSASLYSDYQMTEIYYDNSTDYMQEYSGSTHEHEFNFTVYYEVATAYDISVKVLTENNDSFWVNVSNIQAVERTTIIDILGVKNSYDQNDTLTAAILLKDMYNQPLTGETVNYSITAANGTLMANGSGNINAHGNYTFKVNLTMGTWTGQFYHLNCSYNGTATYLGVWKLLSFDVDPISRDVDADEINLTVNGAAVGSDNFIQVIGNITTFNFSSLDNASFDILMSLQINHSRAISYSETFYARHKFNATSDITEITFDNATLIGHPSNFTAYYFNSLSSSSYTVSGSDLVISDLLDDTYYNDNYFTVQLQYHEEDVRRTQLTSSPKTTSSSVEFEETLTNSRSYDYWYYENEDNLEINELSLEHDRTGTEINSFDNTNNSRYYFEQDCNVGDQFTSTVDFNPNWDVNYAIHANNGTYTKVEIVFSADLAVDDVSLYLDLTSHYIYNENWSVTWNGQTLTPTQLSVSDSIIISGLDFTTSTQTINLTGVSSVPYCSVVSTTSDQKGTQISESTTVDFVGYLNYTKYSQSFFLSKAADWTMYRVYYGDQNYSTQAIDSTTVQFSGEGFDPAVNDSYVHFRTKPFKTVLFDHNTDTDTITITINSSLAVDNCYFRMYFELDQEHILEDQTEGIELVDLSDTEITGYLTFGVYRIEEGITEITIHVNYTTWVEILIQGLLIFGIGGAVGAAWYKISKDEELQKELLQKFNQVKKKLDRDEGKYQELSEIKVEKGKLKGKVK